MRLADKAITFGGRVEIWAPIHEITDFPAGTCVKPPPPDPYRDGMTYWETRHVLWSNGTLLEESVTRGTRKK